VKTAKLIAPEKFEILDLPIPQPQPGEALIKVEYVGICGSDYAIYTGEGQFVKKGLIKYPIILGHEWSGTIVELGDGCNKFQIGDKVVGDGEVSCGKCPECISGAFSDCRNLRGVGTIDAWDGAYSDYIVMPERHIHQIPEGVSMQEAALVEPAAIALKTVRAAKVKMGDVVLVQGTGAIGLSAAHLAHIAGASCIILSGLSDRKLEIGEKMGADIIVNINKTDLLPIVKKVTQGQGVDVVIEASGAQSALRDAFLAVKGGGIISIPAFYERPIPKIDLDDLIFKNVTIEGVCGGAGLPPTILDLMKNGRVNFTPMITDHFALEEVPEAMVAMKELDDTRVKILLKP